MTEQLQALMRTPGEDLGACELTHLKRLDIDLVWRRNSTPGWPTCCAGWKLT